MFLDFGSMVVYALVLVAVFFMTGVVAMFALLHWVVRARAGRAARAGTPAPVSPVASVAPGSVRRAAPVTAERTPTRRPSLADEIPAQRSGLESPLPGLRAAFARAPRPATRRG